MPPVIPPAGQWFANQLAAIKADLAALKSQRTQYIIDAEGVCRAIVGNLASDPAGKSTGLTGFGIAVLKSGKWVNVAEL
jgi:hypothetical protein